jgi:hypothetical protein
MPFVKIIEDDINEIKNLEEFHYKDEEIKTKIQKIIELILFSHPLPNSLIQSKLFNKL